MNKIVSALKKLAIILTACISIHFTCVAEVRNNIFVDNNIHITDILEFSDKSTFHLFSHGRSGELFLDGRWRNSYEILEFIKQRNLINFSTTILNIYGCEFAKGKKGIEAVRYLESKLSVKVNASTNITGEDGDWFLEYGNINSSKFSQTIKGNLQYLPTDDLDGDGIINMEDLDDDEDGISDLTEGCTWSYYSGNNNKTIEAFFSTDPNINVTTAFASSMRNDVPVTNEVSNDIENQYAVRGIADFIRKALTTATDNAVWTFSPGIPANELILDISRLITVGNIEITINGGAVSLNEFTDTIIASSAYVPGTNPIAFAHTVGGNFAIKGVTKTIITSVSFVGTGFPITNNNDRKVYSVIAKNHNCDNDFDGIDNDLDAEIDTDKDGVIDRIDIDDDNDGILDTSEGCVEVASILSNEFEGTFGVLGPGETRDVQSPVEGGYTYATPTNTAGGEYAVISGGYPARNWHYLWANLNGHTTGTSNDAYLAINSDTKIGIFFSGGYDVITPSIYEFGLWIVNAPATLTGYPIEIGIRIKDGNGNILTTKSSGSLPSANRVWVNLKLVRALTPGSYTFEVYNISTALAGNDFALDDIYIRSPITPYCNLDTDGDGVLNHLDPDSDGDTCPDAVEAGTIKKPGVTSRGDSIITNPVSGNGFADVLQKQGADSNLYKYSYTSNIGLSNAVNACVDTDGDGLLNIDDIDDDNDGIVDAIESPSCYYSNTEASKIYNISSTLGTNDNQAHINVQNLHDSSASTTNTIILGQQLANANIYTIRYSTAISLKSISVTGTSTNWGTLSTVILRGSTDGINWLDLTTKQSTETGNPKVFTVTSNVGEYSYFQLLGVDSSTSETIISEEITAVMDTAVYVPSFHSKQTCVENLDGDSLLNHLDLDTDGDGCTDAVEGGLTFSKSNLVQATTISGGNTGVTYTGEAKFPVTENLGNVVDSRGLPKIADSLGQSLGESQKTGIFCLTPKADTTTAKPSCATCPLTVCAIQNDIDTTGGATYATCPPPAVGYTVTGPDSKGCVTYTPNGAVTDTVEACILTCKDGRCDTTRIFIAPPPPKADTTTVKPSCSTCPLTVCAIQNDIDTTGGATYATCPPPAVGYTVTGPDSKGCVTYTPNGAVTDTVEACILTCKDGRCDTTRIFITPPPPKADTTTAKPSCSTCPLTVCAIQNDIDTTGGATYATCPPPPAGYTVTGPDSEGCVTYTPNGAVTDTVEACILTCKDGRCDTTRIFIAPPPPKADTTTAKPICATCPLTVCAIQNDIDTTGGATYATCPPPAAGYTVTGPDEKGCVTYTPNGAVTDTVEACILTCKYGRCDTTRIFIAPPPPKADTTTAKPSCSTCPLTVCAIQNDIDTTGGATYATCPPPAVGYTVTGPDSKGCVTYTPNGAVTDTVEACILTCKDGRCDTTRIFITPPPPKADTTTAKPSCSTCPLTVCAIQNDIDTTGGATYATCPPPAAGYTVTGPDSKGCVTYTPNGAVTDTVEACILTCKDGRCDTTRIFIAPPPPKADTTTAKPICATCPLTVCAIQNDIDTTGGATYATCPPPAAGYTVTGPDSKGCVTYTPNGAVTDTVEACILTCKDGRCDTTRIFIAPPPPKADTTTAKPSCATCPLTVCAIQNDIDTTGGATYATCPPPAVGYTVTGPDEKGCVTYTPNGAVTDTVEACILTCKDGRCDTTRIFIAPPPPKADTTTAKPSCATCPLTVCAIQNDIDTTGGATYATCPPPAVGYTVTGPDEKGCVTYTPNGAVTDTVEACILTCKDGRCDTTRIFIAPPPPKADTTTAKPSCATCPLTVCAIQNDIDTTGGATYATCPPPAAGYTVTGPDSKGCVTYTPNGAVTDTVEACILTCKDGRCDTTRIFIAPPPPKADTTTAKPSCATCPLTVCAIQNDIDTTGGATYATCPPPPVGYTVTGPDEKGCVTYTPNGAVTDTVEACILTCKDGRCDTTRIFIAPAPPKADTTTAKPICATCPLTVCAIQNDVDTTGGATYATCPPPAVGYTVTGPDSKGCVTYTPNGTVKDTVEACILTCKDGRCDTTRIFITPPPPKADTTTVKPSCATCPLTVCAIQNDIDTTGGATYATCPPPPIGYTVTGPDSKGCVTYTPNGAVTDTVEACILTCKDGRCDTTRIFIAPPPPKADTTTAKPSCSTCPLTVCAIQNDIDTTGGATYATCPPPPPVGYTVTGPDEKGCVTYTPNGAVTDTVEACILTCKDGRCDTTRIFIAPPLPKADTTTAKPSCATCPLTVCAIQNDIDTTGGATYATCPPPAAGYTVTGPDEKGCVTYTPNGAVTDTVEACILTCKDGRCDTTRIFIAPPPPKADTTTAKPICATCPLTVCAIQNDIDTTGGATYATCPPPPAGYTVTGPDSKGCVTYTPNGTVKDTVEACILTCKDGRCDTTRIFIAPPPPKADTTTVKPSCATCPLTVCAIQNDIDTTGGATYATCPPPPVGYTVTGPDEKGCVTYTPNGAVTDTVEACILTCKDGRCDTTRIFIAPPPPKADTTTAKPSCATCPLTVCAIQNDIDTTGGATYATCPPPAAGYTVTGPDEKGCVTYTPNGAVTDTVEACILTCKDGRCDTTRIFIAPPPPKADTTTAKPSCATCPLTVCAIQNDIDTTDGATYATCPPPAVGYTVTGPDEKGCVTYTPNGAVTDTVEACILTCKDGRCDTTRIFIAPPALPITPDTIRLKHTCLTCPISPCFVFNDIDPSDAKSFEICDTCDLLSLYIIAPKSNGCYDYQPASIIDQNSKTFIVGCDSSGKCDTTFVFILHVAAALPVTWLSLDASLIDLGAKITWKVSQKDVEYYTIQRSLDGIRFTDIGKMPAVDKDALEISYSYLDTKISSLPLGKIYYRIQSVDLDSKNDYSETVSIVSENSLESSISVYPNPAKGRINFTSLNGVESIQIFNIHGTVVWQKNRINPDKLSYDISNILNGLYFIRLIRKEAKPLDFNIKITR